MLLLEGEWLRIRGRFTAAERTALNRRIRDTTTMPNGFLIDHAALPKPLMDKLAAEITKAAAEAEAS